MINRGNIFISTTSFGVYDKKPIDILKEYGFKFEFNTLKRVLTEEEMIEFLKNKDGLIAGTELLTENVLSKSTSLKVISRVGVGIDAIDIEFAKKRSIQVYTTPDAPINAVAELTVGLMLDLLRSITNSDKNMRMKIWKKETGSLLFGKSIGIIGFGRIGKRLTELLKAFHCDIYIYDPYVSGDYDGVRRFNALNELLRTVDIVTLHLPYSKENHHLINRERLELMKSTSFLINTSRGKLIDEEALYCFLKDGRISGAALDTYEVEPYSGRLLESKNVVLTPHIGSYAKESRIQMEMDSVLNLLKGFGYVGY